MAKRTKYGVSAKVDRTREGIVYMSKLEMNYRNHLEILKKAKKLSERVTKISEQVTYPLHVNGVLVCKYILDFEVTYADGRIEYIDVKGILTSIYKLKKKLFQACYPFKIKEVKRGQF